MRGQLRSLCNRMRDLYLNRLTAQRAARLDNLDALLSTRQPTSTALSQHNALAQLLGDLPDLMIPRLIPRVTIITAAGAGTFTVPAGVYELEVDYCGSGGGYRSGSPGQYGAGGSSVIGAKISVTPGQVITYSVGAGSPAGTNNGNATTINGVGLIAAPGGTNANFNVDFGSSTSANPFASAGTLASGGWGTVNNAGGCALMAYNNAGRGANASGGSGMPGCIVFKWMGLAS